MGRGDVGRREGRVGRPRRSSGSRLAEVRGNKEVVGGSPKSFADQGT